MKTVGYARVSSAGQNLDRQVETMGDVDKLFTEKQSGKNINNRPVFQQCMEFLREEDVLVIHSIDRAARSMQDLLHIVQTLNDKEVTVIFKKENLSFAPGAKDATSTLYLNLLGSIAEFERSLIRERQAEGIKLAMSRGVQFGRKQKLTMEQCQEIADRAKAGEKKSTLAKEFGVVRGTIYSSIKKVETCTQ